jgi:hypothetical protein
VESNTPGTLTKPEENLVDFDYETWRKFGLKLYWPEERGKLDQVWPMGVLTIRVHPYYQMVGLVKEGDLEEVVTFSKDTGRDLTGRCALMDLDSLRDPVLRANTTWEILRSTLGFFWNIARMFKMIMVRSLKEKYNEYRRKKSTT